MLIKWESGQKYPLDLYLYNYCPNHLDSISIGEEKYCENKPHLQERSQNSCLEQLYSSNLALIELECH